MKDSLGCNWFKRRCASSVSFYCSSFFFPGTCFFFLPLSLSRLFQYTQIMADVNEWMREKGEKKKGGEKAETERKDVNHPFFSSTSCFCLFMLDAAVFRRRDGRENEVDWRRRRRIWMQPGKRASSVRCLWRRLQCASPPLPPNRSLHNTQRLRLTRTYQVISGQADLSLSSLLPGPFFWKHSCCLSPLSPALFFSALGS